MRAPAEPPQTDHPSVPTPRFAALRKIQDTAAAMSAQAVSSPPVRYCRVKTLYPLALMIFPGGRPSWRVPT